jgi:hypothetical protein
MISPKEQEPEQDQPQQFGGKSPGNLDLEVPPPVVVQMRSLNHARSSLVPCTTIGRLPPSVEHLYQLFSKSGSLPTPRPAIVRVRRAHDRPFGVVSFRMRSCRSHVQCHDIGIPRSRRAWPLPDDRAPYPALTSVFQGAENSSQLCSSIGIIGSRAPALRIRTSGPLSPTMWFMSVASVVRTKHPCARRTKIPLPKSFKKTTKTATPLTNE